MIRVTVVLPNNKKGEIEIDPAARLIDVKTALVNDLSFLDKEPNEYKIAIVPQDEKVIFSNVAIQEGDTVMIIETSTTRPKPVSGAIDEKFN